jgi:hypothetical protein
MHNVQRLRCSHRNRLHSTHLWQKQGMIYRHMLNPISTDGVCCGGIEIDGSSKKIDDRV